MRDIRRAWGYGVEAARVLRRHPTLLLVPLALVAVDTSETAVGRYVSLTWTTRQPGSTLHLWPRTNEEPTWQSWHVPFAIAARRSFGPGAVGLFETPVRAVSLKGMQRALTSAVISGSNGESGDRTQAVFVLYLALALLSWPLAAVIRSGYYPLAGGCAWGDGFSWQRFGAGARRFFLRFLAFGGLVTAVVALTGAPFLLWPSVALHPIWSKVIVWGQAVIVNAAFVILGLTLVSVVADDRRLFAGMGASARTVIGDVGVTIAALAALFALGGCLVYPLHLLRVLIVDVYSIVAFAESTALSLGIGMIEAFVGTWFLLVSFLWYRDVNAQWAEQSFDTSPAPAVESA